MADDSDDAVPACTRFRRQRVAKRAAQRDLLLGHVWRCLPVPQGAWISAAEAQMRLRENHGYILAPSTVRALLWRLHADERARYEAGKWARRMSAKGAQGGAP